VFHFFFFLAALECIGDLGDNVKKEKLLPGMNSLMTKLYECLKHNNGEIRKRAAEGFFFFFYIFFL
jgi:hypothetical protein